MLNQKELNEHILNYAKNCSTVLHIVNPYPASAEPVYRVIGSGSHHVKTSVAVVACLLANDVDTLSSLIEEKDVVELPKPVVSALQTMALDAIKNGAVIVRSDGLKD